ncbi:MAG TPA: class I SAM-dependent methyltransferase [Nitrospiria bacterium]|nr:class I SAM-dependent methyltransferase [Nitrospiria bacterium]
MLERFMPAGLRWAYTLWSPVYDWVVASSTRESRRKSLASLGDVTGRLILLDGIGTGLDVQWIPKGARYVGLDVTPAMLRRARRAAVRTGRLISLQVGDAMRLPYRNGVFDAVVLHLILAVVPDPRAALAEAARVVKPGGRLVIFDKFLRPGETAWLRRLISPLLGRVATRTDVVFEEALASCTGLGVVSDEPDLAGGWFRRIVLERGA